ncbi:MAG: AsmA family protein [Gallionella sp.]|nr:AsmA family protein [Gallionella sp.]
MKKPLYIATSIAAALILIPAVVLVVLLNVDWNLARPWLNARTSEALGRPFVIAGDLSLTWEKQASINQVQDWRGNIPWPHLIARDIHISNPPNMTASAESTAPVEMAGIRQIDFSLNPFALLKKNIEIPLLRFDSPAVNLRLDADGRNNWTFRNDDKPSPWQLKLQKIIFTKGSVHLIDAIRHADVTANIDTLDTDPTYGMKWQLHGKLGGDAVSGAGRAGAVLSLQQQTVPYPIMARLHIGQTVIAVEGVLTKPSDLAALDMHLNVSGVSMGRLYALSGIYLPETPPFATEGHLIGTLGPHGSRWIYDNFSGKVGASDIGGRITYQSRQPRPLLSGTVVSHVLHLSDLAPLIGADSKSSQARRGAATIQPANKVLPIEPFRTERWTSIDADVKFSAHKIIRDKALPIKELMTNVHLQDGVLSLLPLNFDIAGGNLSSNMTLDGNGKSGKNAIKATMKVTARHLQLKQLFPTLQPLQASLGEINGDASLSAVGNSIASLLGTSNGEIKMLINQGTVSKLLLEEMGLNIGSVILSNLFGDKPVKLNCMATDLGVTNGLIQTRSFIIDTNDAIIDVSGKINLTQEQLDLTIKTMSRGLRVLSLRAPIYVRGSFTQPRVSVDKGVLVMKAGGTIALIVLAPVAALIPLINTGPGKDSECAKLLAAARIKPVSPPAGQTYRRKIKPGVK